MFITGIIFILNSRKKLKHHSNYKDKSKKLKINILFGAIAGIVGLISGVLIIPNSIVEYVEIKNVYKNEKYQIIEGMVESFDPMPIDGHKNESFCLQKTCFEYSDFDTPFRFKNTKSHGGPITHNGQRLRLSYINRNGENIILKIEKPI